MAEDFRMMPMSSRVAQGDTAVLKCLAPRLEIILKMMMRVVMVTCVIFDIVSVLALYSESTSANLKYMYFLQGLSRTCDFLDQEW